MDIKPFDPKNAIITTDIMLQALIGAGVSFDYGNINSCQRKPADSTTPCDNMECCAEDLSGASEK